VFLCLSSVGVVVFLCFAVVVGVFGGRLYTFDVIFMVLVCLNLCFVWVAFFGLLGYHVVYDKLFDSKD